ncbi:LAGLIDADG family homing endonuclease [Candidatus Deferrimicrobium sp.]|uniref:LAGLIDADG family homing endonuclease n=1 Tax=Candidatus Deferrimicrobium sp. TaxID=3060586 RepID=UPI002ED6411C
MDLNVPATLTPPESAVLNVGPGRPAAKTLHDHPPQAWAEGLLRKYGPMPVSENARTVLERRYLKKGMKGDPLETPEEMACRVAYNIALAEGLYYGALPEVTLRWAEAFYAMMLRLDFLPNSPTLMNAGRELQQLSACFVLPVEDSMESIFEAVKNTALIHKSGGGTGFSFSRLRPHADVVRSTKGVSSGPISFMTVFDAATETIKQGGTRRGANMGILRVDHPDILDFITCKSQTNRLNNFNISVALTEEFMKAVESGEEYSLVNPHSREVTGRLPAREVFERIVDSSWKNGEPGMIFIDRINRDNPTPRIGAIESTNPCVTGDTFVMTKEGPRQVKELLDRRVDIVVDGQVFSSADRGFFPTGKKPVFRLTTREGHTLRLTGDHPVLKAASVSRYNIVKEWTPASSLCPGDKIFVHNHRELAAWGGPYGKAEGYLLGLLVGDGTLKRDKAVISVWVPDKVVNGEAYVPEGPRGVMAAALACAVSLPHRSDFNGWQEIPGRNECRPSLAVVKEIAGRLGMEPGQKVITPEAEKCSSDFYRGFLGGLFDADGSVQGNQEKGVSIRLAQSNLELLETVQRMLLRIGIASTLYRNRRPPGETSLPDGHGSSADYRTKAQHELAISNDNVQRFADRIGFMDTDKQARLVKLLNSHTRRYNRERFLATVDSFTTEGTEEVFDIQVPGVNAFDANGFFVHNCGEQPLLPYESCNLGSINLANMIATQDGHARIDYDKLKATVHMVVRFLDDVIDMNNYPLAEIRHMTVGNRKIGLGVMGFADMLIALGTPYDSDEALAVAQELMSFIQEESGAASCSLARERGPFPNYDVSVFPERGGAPRRNATTTTIAPTGTISIIAGVSSGIEPIFALSYIRNVMDNDHLVEVHPLFDAEMRRRGLYSVERMTELSKVGSLRHLGWIPEDVARVYVTAHDISPEAHLRMQAAFQKYTENAVSKTVNFPADATREDIRKVFVLAYRLGCKGVTVYRDKSREEQVLNIGGVNAKAEAQEQEPAPGPEMFVTPRPRPDTLIGVTKEIKTSCGKLYVTINRDEKGIFEVFNQMGKAGGCAASQSEAIGRLASLALRSGVQPGMIVKQLKGISCHLPSWGGNGGGKILSCADAVSKAIEWYLENFEAMFPGFPMPVAEAARPAAKKSSLPAGEEEIARGACPDCGSQVERQEGCLKCRSCGFSEC